MPELPEVETLLHSLKRGEIEGSYITYVKVFNTQILTSPSPTFEKTLIDKKIERIGRRAKYLIFSLSDGYFLVIHLKMTGHLSLSDKIQKAQKHEHLQFGLNTQKILSFFDQRKFGRIYLLNDLKSFFSHLGPEPLDPAFDYKILLPKIKKSKRMIKALLLDQSFIAGLGNIYTDEALWEAKIHPQKLSSSLSLQEIKILFKAIKKSLQQGINNRGTSLGKNRSNFSDIYEQFGKNQEFLNAYGRFNKPCKRCKTLIKREKIAQRSSYFCPSCQR
jgi:formamidopyrimidine-DNA glycosylase